MRKRKSPQKLSDDLDFSVTFGVKDEKLHVFTDNLENNLANQDFDKILKEKSDRSKTPLTRKDIIKQYPPAQDDLDLHKLTRDQATIKAVDFIRLCTSLKYRTIKIITGKGLHSDGPAVLPDIIENKLLDLKDRDLIFDFKWEQGEKHRSGAVLVYLR